MTFREKNPNYIHQAFDVGMRGLEDKQRIERYGSFKYGNLIIKDDIHFRLQEYYVSEHSRIDLSSFYAEIINLIGVYDGDYIITNLLFEKSIVEITNHLIVHKLIELVKITDQNSSAGRFMIHLKYFIENRKSYSKSDFEKYTLSELNRIVGSSAENTLIKDSTSLAKEYSKWIVNNLEQTDKCVNSYLPFLMCWNILVLNTPARTAILLLHYVIDTYKNIVPQGLYRFTTSCTLKIKGLFTLHNNFLPLIDEKGRVDFGQGYNKKREEFIELVMKSKIIDLLSKNESYEDLFKTIEENQDQDIRKGVEKILKEKIATSYFLTETELTQLFSCKVSETTSKIQLLAIKRFYLFEYYDSLDMIKRGESLVSQQNVDNSNDVIYTSFRLISAASHFGVSISTLSQFLAMKGVDTSNINAQSKLTEYQLSLIQSEFIGSNTNVAKLASEAIRYSDKELLEFKILIQQKIQISKKHLCLLNEQIKEKDIINIENLNTKKFKISKDKFNTNKEHLHNSISRESIYLLKLEEALKRIENKTYGICRVTGKLIDKARLKALPHVTLSIEAKNSI